MYDPFLIILFKNVCLFKKYSRGTGGQIFVIYGQPMDSNIIISYASLRCKISYLNTKNCPDLHKGRYLKPSKSHAISFDRRLCDAPSWILSSQLITGTRLVSTPDIHPISLYRHSPLCRHSILPTNLSQTADNRFWAHFADTCFKNFYTLYIYSSIVKKDEKG
jgi:hypothetical protein